MDALTKEQLVVYVYVQVITLVKSFLISVRWDEVWGTGGHRKGQALVSLQLVWHLEVARRLSRLVQETQGSTGCYRKIP